MWEKNLTYFEIDDGPSLEAIVVVKEKEEAGKAARCAKTLKSHWRLKGGRRSRDLL